MERFLSGTKIGDCSGKKQQKSGADVTGSYALHGDGQVNRIHKKTAAGTRAYRRLERRKK